MQPSESQGRCRWRCLVAQPWSLGVLLSAALILSAFPQAKADLRSNECLTWSLTSGIETLLVDISQGGPAQACCDPAHTCAAVEAKLGRVPVKCRAEVDSFYRERIGEQCAQVAVHREVPRRLQDCVRNCEVGTPSSCLGADSFSVLQCSEEFGRGRCFGEDFLSFEVPFYSNVYDPLAAYTLQLGCCSNFSVEVSNGDPQGSCVDYGIPAEFEKIGDRLRSSLLVQKGDGVGLNVTSGDGSLTGLLLENTINVSDSPLTFAQYTNFTSQSKFTRSSVDMEMWVKGEGDEMLRAGGLVVISESSEDEEHLFRVQQSLLREDAGVESESTLELYQAISFVHGVRAPQLESPVGGNQLGENRLMNCTSRLLSDNDLSIVSCQADDSTGAMSLALEPGVTVSTISVFFETQSVIYEDNRRRRLTDVLTNASCFGYLACVALADSTIFLDSSYEYELFDSANLEPNQFDEGTHEFMQEDSDSSNSNIYVTMQTPRLTFDTNSLPSRTVQVHRSNLQVDPPEILDFLPYYTGNQTPPARMLVESSSLGVRNRSSEERLTTIVANPLGRGNSLQLGTIVEESYQNADRGKISVGLQLEDLEDEVMLDWSTNFSAETVSGGVLQRKMMLQLNKTDPYLLDVSEAEFCLQDWALEDAVSAGVSLYGASSKANVSFYFRANDRDGSMDEEVWTWYQRNFSQEEPFTGFEVWLNESSDATQYSSTVSTGENDWKLVYKYESGPEEEASFTESGSFLQRSLSNYVDYSRYSTDAMYRYDFTALINKVEEPCGCLLKNKGDGFSLEVEIFKAVVGSGATAGGQPTDIEIEKEDTRLVISTEVLTTGGEEYWCRYMYVAGGKTTTGYRQVFQQDEVVIDLSINTTNPFVPTPSPTVPTVSPTTEPTTLPPTNQPTNQPSNQPTAEPTSQPTPLPSSSTSSPTPAVTVQPSTTLTERPTSQPTTSQPSTPSTAAPTPSVSGWVRGLR